MAQWGRNAAITPGANVGHGHPPPSSVPTVGSTTAAAAPPGDHHGGTTGWLSTDSDGDVAAAHSTSTDVAAAMRSPENVTSTRAPSAVDATLGGTTRSQNSSNIGLAAGPALAVGSDSDDTHGSATQRRHFTLSQFMGLFACSFSYAFIFNSINNIVIPKEIERLAPSRQSIWVGLIMAAGALSQLATPVVGAASDRSGQRTTYLVYGSVATVVGIMLFMFTTSLSDMSLLFTAHVVTSLGLSMQYSMVTALLNDHVVEEQVGRGSGAMAILAIVGSGAGYVMFAFNLQLHLSYISYIVATITCLFICLATVPTHVADSGAVVHRRRAATLTMGTCTRGVNDVMHALSVPSPKKYPDFFFACLGRALFNTGLAGQVYLVYYFRDVLGHENPSQLASIVAVAALVGGVVGALPAGIISDRVGKKPVIYWSILVCVIALALFMVAREVLALQVIGFVYGVGNVAYLSVDYALGVQSLPRRTGSDGRVRGQPIDAAKDLGVFAMSATAGQLLGQVIYAAVLEHSGWQSATGFVQYSYIGFVGVYATGCAAFLVAGVATAFIRTVR